MNQRLRGIVTVDDEVLASRCAKGRVTLIDDDPEILLALSALLEFEGLACDCYASATAYLQELAKPQLTFPGPVCVLCDVNMPELTGLDLQKKLQTLQDTPLLLMSGVSGAQEAASAFRAGAVDFLVKPIDATTLLGAIYRALELSTLRQCENAHKALLSQRAQSLTEREHEVLTLVAQGMTNQAIAEALKIALRTVKLHRQRGMEKLQTATTADLVRIMDKLHD